MHRIPKDLDLSPLVGAFTTQVRVGQFDLQFTFGRVNFAVQCDVTLLREGNVVALWEGGRWPDPGFYDILNTEVLRCDVVHERLLALTFANGLVMHLLDDSDQYESMQITFEEDPSPWLI